MFSEVKITTSPRGQWVNYMMFNPMYQSSWPSRGQLRFSSEVGTGHSATVSSIMLAPLGSSDQAVGALPLSFSGWLLALGSQLPWPHDSWRPRLLLGGTIAGYYHWSPKGGQAGRIIWGRNLGLAAWLGIVGLEGFGSRATGLRGALACCLDSSGYAAIFVPNF